MNWTAPNCTSLGPGLRRAKPRPASPNHVRSAPF